MNPELPGHRHYQLVLLLNGWCRFDWSPRSTDLEYCNKQARLDELETLELLLSRCCGMCPRKLHYSLIWHHEQICLQLL